MKVSCVWMRVRGWQHASSFDLCVKKKQKKRRRDGITLFSAQSPSIFAAFPNLPRAGREQVLVRGRGAVRSSRRGRRIYSLLHLVARRSSQRRRYFNSAARTVECAPRVGKARTSFPPRRSGRDALGRSENLSRFPESKSGFSLWGETCGSPLVTSIR